MSARQPFVPSRPVSRASNLPNPRTPQARVANTNDTFSSNSSSRLAPPGSSTTHRESKITQDHNDDFNGASDGQKSRSPECATNGADSNKGNTGSLINKPLNISGLMQKKRPQVNSLPKPRKSIEGVFRPNSANPWSTHSTPQSLNDVASRIASPRPKHAFYPAHSGSSPSHISSMVPSNSFKTPMVPSSSSQLASLSAPNAASASRIPLLASNVHSELNAGSANAHIPTQNGQNGLNVRPGVAVTATSTSAQSFISPPPPNHGAPGLLELRLHSSFPSLEQIQESAAEDEEDVILVPQDLDAGDYMQPQRAQTLKRMKNLNANKRSQPENGFQEGSDEDYGYGVETKRWKGDLNGVNSPQRAASTYSRRSTPYRAQGQENDHQAGVYGHAEQVAPMANDGIRRLFGQDLNVYLEKHADAYERATKKWAECGREEWIAGGEELSGKFAEIMDFVKGHMTTKINLYTSLHSSLSEHQAVLGDREKVLKDVREGLVRESGNVLGLGSNSNAA